MNGFSECKNMQVLTNSINKQGNTVINPGQSSYFCSHQTRCGLNAGWTRCNEIQCPRYTYGSVGINQSNIDYDFSVEFILGRTPGLG